MATRSERLQRLTIGSACTTAWDGMKGGGPRRYCDACCRTVLDVAQLTPAAVHAHLEASHGKLCARLSREGGRLLMAPPPPIDTTTPLRPRPSLATLAAGLLTAVLGAARGEASPGPERAVATGEGEAGSTPEREPTLVLTTDAALQGRVQTESGEPVGGVSLSAVNTLDGSAQSAISRRDGSFSFESLPAGIYDVSGGREGYEVTYTSGLVLQPGEVEQVEVVANVRSDSVTTGVIVVATDPLRTQFASSDLVVGGVAGASRVAERDGSTIVVITELHVETWLKGERRGNRVDYRHHEYGEEGAPPDEALASLAPGAPVLAFLQRVEEGSPWRPLYEASSYSGFGVKVLAGEERAAYLERLEALARVEQRAERRGESDPAEIVEWLVDTTVDAFTRGEVVGELAASLDALDERAQEAGVAADVTAADLRALVERFRSEGGALRADPPPAVLGAHHDAAHRDRLTAALLASEQRREADLALYALVRRWHGEVADQWLAKVLRAAPAPTVSEEEDEFGNDELWQLLEIAAEHEDEGLVQRVEEAIAREREIDELWPEDTSEATERLREERRAAVREELRRELAAALSPP